MSTLLIIIGLLSLSLFAMIFINENIIGKLPNNSRIKKFWRKHICDEDEGYN
jgi:hypothetical protein